MALGPGCGTIACSDCDGACYGERIIPVRPFDRLRQLRRQMVCGSGCGGTYFGEWISTPPDCEDPCCNGEFVGGAVKARFGCWQPGLLIGNLYGSRMCSAAESTAPCGCGESWCEGNCGHPIPATPYSMDTGEVMESSDCGCGSPTHTPGAMSVTRAIPDTDPITLSVRSAKQQMATSGRLQR